MQTTSSAHGAAGKQVSKFAIFVWQDGRLEAVQDQQPIGTAKRGDANYMSYFLEAMHGVYTENYDVQVHFVPEAAA